MAWIAVGLVFVLLFILAICLVQSGNDADETRIALLEKSKKTKL